MKNELPIGSLELPDDWEDRTSYQFVSPPSSDLDMPLARGRGISVNAARRSVLLARALIPKGKSFTEFLTEQTDELRKALNGFRLNARDSWQHPKMGAIETVDLTFEIGSGMPVRQLQFYFPTSDDDLYINLTISCSAPEYEKCKSELKAIFESYTSVQPVRARIRPDAEKATRPIR